MNKLVVFLGALVVLLALGVALMPLQTVLRNSTHIVVIYPNVLVAIPLILLIVLYNPRIRGHAWVRQVRDGVVYATVLATVASGWPYVVSAARSARDNRQ